jgi:hypothetical protein
MLLTCDCPAYQSESWCIRPDLEEHEKLVTTDGIVVESVSKKVNYAYYRFSNALGKQSASVSERLFVDGKLYIKAYSGGSDNSGNVAAEWTDVEKSPDVSPRLQPHGLAIMRYSETVGNKSDLARFIPQFLRNLRFLEEKGLPNGEVRGTWHTRDPNYQVHIDFSSSGRPVRTTWGNVKAMGSSSCNTITKWRDVGNEVYVPEVIEFSDVLGKTKTEAKFTFQYLPKKMLAEKLTTINKDFAKLPGKGWHKEIEKWFEEK